MARVEGSEVVGARVRNTVQFIDCDSELQDWLDKTIFRRHRREIFDQRQQAKDDAATG
jgi:hypothetical protein